MDSIYFCYSNAIRYHKFWIKHLTTTQNLKQLFYCSTGDGSWSALARALTGGYSQVEVTADAFCDPTAFDKIPDRPFYPFRASGQEVKLVSYSKGKVKSTPGYEVLKMLPSFVQMDGIVSVGDQVDYTQDLITAIGSVIISHPDGEIVKRDIEFIR